MIQKKKAVIALLISMLLSACTAIEKSTYPQDWPAIDLTVTDCSAISGVYDSAAELQTHRHPRQDVLLALTLLPPGEYLKQVRSVSLQVKNHERVAVHALAEDGAVLAERSYRIGDGFFRCEDGALIVNPDNMPDKQRAPDNPVVGITRNRISLHKAQDGALIMQEAGSATGLAFLLVPVHVQSEEWYLFRLWRKVPTTP
ncbi:hypothetical protein [Thiohalomonas denitrificans]|uniref:Lipoprotein n=1 Tax=Thiohalomonas denitrificans TaxID=415747 RepID=A0A1G5QZX7_9GAMM|nr:hypothetical protein [Thiohalomonas denitrificans]SCZ67405.1 hypothetical protein SAMN03097708_03145 [Thiohalomonas denitrificans]